MTLGLLLSVPFAARAFEPNDGAFLQVWSRSDSPVKEGIVSRTWLWGAEASSGAFQESYVEGADGARTVQYFEKGRMESSSPSDGPNDGLWSVTSGLLVVELATGRMQVGDAVFTQREPAQINAAGDPGSYPRYADLQPLFDAAPLPVGEVLTGKLQADGTIVQDAQLAGYGALAAYHVAETNHTVASPFWELMQSSGTVYEDGGYTIARLFPDPFYMTGFPVTEAYWAQLPVGGVARDVLLQCFERRCLTYTPDNPEGWQVEFGNIGRHYYQWRYEDIDGNGLQVDQEPALSIPSLEDGGGLELPASLPYAINGYVGGLVEGVHIQLTVDDPASGYTIDIPLTGVSGELTIPDDKLLVGQHDVTFQIVDARDVPFSNPGSRLTVSDLLITGRRTQAT
jgi:hypothetical protein